MGPALLIACLALGALGILLARRQQKLRREALIRSYVLPKGLFEKLRERHPGLSLKDCQLVSQGLRQFFLGHLKSGRQYVAMPSQVADDLWHEFILYTKNYDHFCKAAFGRFLHHTPAVVMSQGQQSDAGIKRSWYYACHEENINPKSPTRLPLLFALDSKLDIPNGFVYVADCGGAQRQHGDGSAPYCAADFGSSGSGCGGGDSSADSGCGGGGCGGGD